VSARGLPGPRRASPVPAGPHVKNRHCLSAAAEADPSVRIVSEKVEKNILLFCDMTIDLHSLMKYIQYYSVSPISQEGPLHSL